MTHDYDDYEKKLPFLLEHLQVITTGLITFTGRKGDTEEQKNQLLRECYNLRDEELLTIEEWHNRGCLIREREHGYLFWKGKEVKFLYTPEQVVKLQLTLF